MELEGCSRIALKRKPKATKFNEHRTTSLITHTGKIVARILRGRIEKKIDDALELRSVCI
jgi:predicted DNA-binding protein